MFASPKHIHLVSKEPKEQGTSIKVFWCFLGVIQTWNQEGRQYLRRFAADEVGVAAVDVAQLPSSSHHHRHDAPLR